jgi:putative DNA primase/helicase
LPQIVNAAVRAISDPDKFHIFKQEDRLLEVATLDTDESNSFPIRRPKGSIILRGLTNARMVDILTQAAEWQSRDAKGKLHRKNAPKHVAETILARPSWPPIKELLGVVEAPTIILNSGETLDHPGYHPSGLYFYAGPAPDIPAHPSRDDAIKAVASLKQPFSQFPFLEPPVHSSAYLAALLTANIRRQLPTAPALNTPAAAYGTGKTLLCDAIGIVTTGRDCAKMAVPEDDENELRKRLFGLLLGGDAVAALDNITGVLRSPFISAVLTSKEFKERQLGFIQNPLVRTNMTLLFNGNALVMAGDISTRTVPIEQDAKCERPAQREGFKITPLRAI